MSRKIFFDIADNYYTYVHIYFYNVIFLLVIIGLNITCKIENIIIIINIDVVKIEYISNILISPQSDVLKPGMNLRSKINVIGPHGIK